MSPMRQPINRKAQRDRAELREEKYRVCYAQLLEALDELDEKLRTLESEPLTDLLASTSVAHSIRAKVGEILVTDKATWHLYTEEEKRLRRIQLRRNTK